MQNLQQKYRQKSKVKKKVRSVDFSLKTSLNVVLYKCVIHLINIATKSKFKVVLKGHLMTLDMFQKRNSLIGNAGNEAILYVH